MKNTNDNHICNGEIGADRTRKLDRVLYPAAYSFWFLSGPISHSAFTPLCDTNGGRDLVKRYSVRLFAAKPTTIPHYNTPPPR